MLLSEIFLTLPWKDVDVHVMVGRRPERQKEEVKFPWCGWQSQAYSQLGPWSKKGCLLPISSRTAPTHLGLRDQPRASCGPSHVASVKQQLWGDLWTSSGWDNSLDMKVKVSHTVVSDSLRFHGLQPVLLLCPWDSPGKSTRVGCHFLLQGIFPTQGLKLGLLH